MADATVSWSRNSTVFSVDPNEKLFVFGYSCKIFRDDEKAKYIDQGKHLIPWMGDKTLMIDRYDVRGYLHDLKQYEPKAEGFEDPLAEEELQCDQERYRSLRSDMSEEQLYHEEELKRLRAAIAGDGAYHEIAFTYDSAENKNYEDQEESKVEEPEDELFELPQGLSVPKDMELPYTMKIHAIIEKTANFVSQQGGQMEIIIKMKQQANPQFAFMHLDNPLYPYYKHLLKEIKAGAYKPVQVKKVSQSEDDDDDDGHYLHPSLMAGRPESVPKFTVPTINFRRSSDDSYSVLVRNLQQHFMEETPQANENTGHKKNAMNSTDGHIVPPPPDYQPIVDKMAEYVAKNGDDFEIIVKSRKDKRFDFLHPWHEFYNYYIHKRDTAKIMLSAENAESQPQESIGHINATPLSAATQGSSSPQITAQPELRREAPDDFIRKVDALYPDSQDDEDSVDVLDSPKDEEDSKEDIKPVKVLKGPISFSLKSKDAETPTDKTNITALLLDYSDGESGGEGCDGKKKSAQSRINAVEGEVKVPKPHNEFLEAKHAEERIRDKLLATARERMSQQRREKQLQAEKVRTEERLKEERLRLQEQQRREKGLQVERKRKAALFLRMLEKGKAPDVVSHIIGSERVVRGGGKQRRHLPIPGIKADCSSDSASEHSGEEEPISVIGEKLSSASEGEEPEKEGLAPTLPKGEEPVTGHALTEEKKKRKKHSKHKSKKSRHRSRSPPSRYREEREPPAAFSPPARYREEKRLPAAYSLNKRSRSRSRSPPPPRYRPNFNYWNRRR